MNYACSILSENLMEIFLGVLPKSYFEIRLSVSAASKH